MVVRALGVSAKAKVHESHRSQYFSISILGVIEH